MRDARLRPEAPGAAIKKEEVAVWRARVESFLTAELAHEGNGTGKQTAPTAKWHRIATFDLVCGMDWQIRSALGLDGWKTFKVGERPLNRIHLRRRCTLLWDKGPDKMCAAGYILNKLSLRVAVFFSPAHGAQRAMWGGVQGCGKYALLLLACAVVNLERGPWHGEANHQQIRESTLEWQTKASGDRQDPLLRYVLPRLLESQGKDKYSITDEEIDAIVDGITDANFYSRKLPKTTLTQWNTLNDSLVLLPEWWLKLSPLMHLGIMQGWCNCNKGAQLLTALKPADLDAVKESLKNKEPTSVAHSKVRRMRDGCPGSMKLVTFAMLDQDFRVDLEMICFVTSPWRRFHSEVQKGLNSSGACDFHVDIVNGRGIFWMAMGEAMRPFMDLECLGRMGFVVSVASLPPERFNLDSPDMHMQSKLVMSLWLLIFGEIACFLKNFVHFFATYPGKFALLLGPEEDREAHYQDMRKDFEAYEDADTRPQPMLKRICRRSLFQWTEVEEVFTYYNGRYDNDIYLNAQRMFSHFGDTTLIEKHFQIKSDQCKDPAGRKIAPATMWRGPIRQKVLSEIFQYGREASVNDAPDMSAKATLPQSLHRNQYGKKVTSMDFTDLPSRSQKSSWERYGCDSWPTLAAESVFLRLAFDQRKLSDAEHSRRTQFLRPGMVVQENEEQIVVVAAYMAPLAVCFKVKVFTVGPCEFFDFDLVDGAPSLVYKVVWKFAEWKVRPMQWCAPVHLLRANGFRQFATFPSAFGVAEPGGAVKLLEHCACKGFWDISESAINMLVEREFGLQLSQRFVDTLVAVIRKITGCGEEAAVRCIEHRLAYLDLLSNSYEGVLESDEFYESVDGDTRESASTHVEATSGVTKARKEMQTEVPNRIQKIWVAKAEAAAANQRKKKAKKEPNRGKWNKTEPSPLPADEELYALDYVQGLTPEGTKVIRDIFNGRWQMYWRLVGPPPGPWRSISRSWGSRNQSECVRECLQAVWTWAMAEQDIECPVANLFPAAAAQAAGSASSSSGSRPA